MEGGEAQHTPEEEIDHIIQILSATKKALAEEDASSLRELSNQTIHCAAYIQDSGSITLAVIIYTLSKLIERSDQRRLKKWPEFSKRFNSWISLNIQALQEKKMEQYERYLEEMRKTLAATSINLKPYIQEVLRKASINKASRIYHHGISLGKTAQLLGITQWELSEYAGQKEGDDQSSNTLDVKKRAKTALEFFS